jgi:hypothetical protein
MKGPNVSSFRIRFAAAGLLVVLLPMTVSSRQANPANSKTIGLIRALASPGNLGSPDLPGPTSPFEKLMIGQRPVTRGPDFPRLDLFVQYRTGPAAAGGTVVRLTPDLVKTLVANDAVQAIELLRPPSFQLEEVVPFNRHARLTHRVDEFVAKFGFIGLGTVAAVIDEGGVRDTHQEFQQGRAQRLTKAPFSTHSTHVAGTIIAAGLDPRAKGMAPAASVISLDFDNDLQDLANLPADGLEVTNHSYGPVSGWNYHPQYGWMWWGDRSLSNDDDVTFGRYGARESTLDGLLHDALRSRWLSFVAAGNDRNDGPRTQPVAHFVYTVRNGQLDWEASDRIRLNDGGKTGFDTVSGLCVAKNTVCIGAIEDAKPGAAASTFVTTSFSAFGPADDGRIKPDLTANGQNLLSTSDADDQAYLEMPGTSMASPTAAGIGLIVGQAFDKHRGRLARGIDVKATLIHTAVDAGRPGPDAEFGWGVINALAAGSVVADAAHLIESIDVGQGSLAPWPLQSNGTDPIRITLVWNDPAGRANTGGLDNSAPALVNDLDIQLVGPGGTIHFPYRLDVANPSANARRDGVNRVDNVEVIDALPSAGSWQLQIRGFALQQGPVQNATIIVSGLRRTP